MKCPVCLEVNLAMMERQGIEVDYCPQCRGVWLDRGELDKIIERSTAMPTAPEQGQEQQRRASESPPYAEGRGSHDDRDDERKRKKRSGFLGELFDF